jgi:pSer/pThr/pTyr-binding forkhead associated (FHA) protein
MREESNTGRRSSPVAATPPPPPYEEEEAQAPILSGEHEHLATGEHGEADSAYDGAEPAPEPLTLYIEVPGEDAVPMEGDEFIIGRGKTCNFVIDSNRVSRQHARIIRDGDEFILEDLNSSNGTFFGKQREKVTRRIIVSGDEFIFGTERVTFYIQ